MRIGILGTGSVARTPGGAFVAAGHDVVLGSRTTGADKVTFAEAVAHGEVLVKATAGAASVDAIGASERTDRERKLLLELGWPAARLLDLGGLSAARGMEMYLPLWLTLMRTLGTPAFNVAVERARSVEAGE